MFRSRSRSWRADVSKASFKPVKCVDAEKLSGVAGHVCVVLDKLILVTSGYFLKNSSEGPLAQRYRGPEDLYVFHTEHDKWVLFETTGEIPVVNSGGTAVLLGLDLFLFAGFLNNPQCVEGSRQFRTQASNFVYRLDLRLMRWTRCALRPDTLPPTPRHKAVGWLHGSKLYFFGGYGPHPDLLEDRGAYLIDSKDEFLPDYQGYPPSQAWNNQLLEFDPVNHTWSNVRCSGSLPPPRAACSAVPLGDGRVVLFGGRHGEERLNDLYILSMSSLVWTKVDLPSAPVGRSWHSMAEMGRGRLVLYGGFTQDCVPLSDIWLLDLGEMSWRRMLSWECGKPRLWHTGVVLDGNLFVYGGCARNILDAHEDREYCNDLIVVRRSPKSLKSLCVSRVAESRSYESFLLLPASVRRQVIFAQQTIFRENDVRSVVDLCRI